MGTSSNGHRPIYEAMVKFFQDDEWHPEQFEDSSFIRMFFAGNNGNWTCLAYAEEANSCVNFSSILDVNVPVEKLPAMAELLMKLNKRYVIGNFMLDYEEGWISFRTTAVLTKSWPDYFNEVMGTVAHSNLAIVEDNFPSLMGLLFDNTSPDELLAKLEAEFGENE